METAAHNLEALGVDPSKVPAITRDLVRQAKLDPDLLIACAERLGVDIVHSLVLRDSIWDMLAAQRARSLEIGLLSGGYGRKSLNAQGPFGSMRIQLIRYATWMRWWPEASAAARAMPASLC